MKECPGKVVFLRSLLQIVEKGFLIAQAAMTITFTAFQAYKTVSKSSKFIVLGENIYKTSTMNSGQNRVLRSTLMH